MHHKGTDRGKEAFSRYPSKVRSIMDGRRKTEAKIAGRVGEMEEQISSVAENAQEASELVQPLKDKAERIAEQQKEAGAEQIGGVARAVRGAAGELERERQPVTSTTRRNGWIAPLRHCGSAAWTTCSTA